MKFLSETVPFLCARYSKFEYNHLQLKTATKGQQEGSQGSCQQVCMTCVQSPGPTQWTERMNSQKSSSETHMYHEHISPP